MTTPPRQASPAEATDARTGDGGPSLTPSAAALFTFTSDQLQDLIAGVAAKLAGAGGQAPAGDATMLEALKALTASSIAQNAATARLGDEVKRTVRRQNAEHEHVSIFEFHPRCPACMAGERHSEDEGGRLGHPKADFILETYWPANCRAVKEDYTVMEVEMINKLAAMMLAAKQTKRTARHGQLKAILDNRNRRLTLDTLVFRADDRNSLPDLIVLILQLIDGTDALDPQTVFAEFAAMREQVERLQAQLEAQAKAAAPAAEALPA